MRIDRAVLRATCAAAALLALSAEPVFVAAQDLSISVTALGTRTAADLGGQPLEARGPTFRNVTGAPLRFSMTDSPGAKQAILLLTDGEVGVATLVVDGAAVELKTADGVRFQATMIAAESGSLGVHVRGGEAAPTLVSIPGATVRLASGSLRCVRTSAGVEISLGSGRATVYSGPVPHGGVGALTDGAALDAAGDNSLTVGADGALSPPARRGQAAAEMRAHRSAIGQRSLLPDMVAVAEQVTEGDIEPPTRGAAVPPTSVAVVSIPVIVPRGGLASQVISGSQGFATSTVQASAESFIGSQNAALAVVGARLQRTRITGAIGGGGGGPLSINRELLRPFTIGPLRR